MSRCDSAAIVSKTSELLPEPDTPVNTVRRRFGISTLTSLRLFTRAPITRIRSWLSAAWSPSARSPVLVAVVIVSPSVGRWGRRNSRPLLDADEVARGIAEGAVADTVRLVGRLLDHLGLGLQLLEGGVDVAGGQQDPAVGALGHHLGDGAALLV